MYNTRKVNWLLLNKAGTKKRLVMGVTGSPGSGKTSVSALFGKLGAYVLDVDQAGKWVLDNDIASRNKVKQTFGQHMFTPNGNLDRKRLGSVVFSDPEKLEKLDRIVHPVMINRVRTLIQQYLYSSFYDFIVVDAALLFELFLHTEMDLVLTVKADENVRLQRLCDRHHVDMERARQITNAQWSQDRKIKGANLVLDNSGAPNEMKSQVEAIYRQLTGKF